METDGIWLFLIGKAQFLQVFVPNEMLSEQPAICGQGARLGTQTRPEFMFCLI